MRDRKKAQVLAHELVSKMTIEERASQLKFDAPPVERLGVPAYNWWNEALHGVARAGTATMFPQPVAMASMFDPEMIRKIGDVVATEARAKYNEASKHGDRDIYKGLTFWSPNINLFRDPRWGRGQETYSEDPYLTARLGVAYIKGLQGDGKYLKVAACAKHYAVHSGPEAIRHEFDAEVSQKDLWETYLPAFEAAVKEGEVEAVMGAYNRTLGEPCCGSDLLIRKILRGKFGIPVRVTIFAPVRTGVVCADIPAFDTVTALPESPMRELPKLAIVRAPKDFQRRTAGCADTVSREISVRAAGLNRKSVPCGNLSEPPCNPVSVRLGNGSQFGHVHL